MQIPIMNFGSDPYGNNEGYGGQEEYNMMNQFNSNYQ